MHVVSKLFLSIIDYAIFVIDIMLLLLVPFINISVSKCIYPTPDFTRDLLILEFDTSILSLPSKLSW